MTNRTAMSNKNPLEELLVDEKEQPDHTELLRVLKPYIQINKTSRQVEFLSSFHHLKNNEAKLLVVFASSKAKASLLGVEERVSPSDIIKLDIMPAGSVKTAIRGLLKSGEVKRESGKYYIPNYKIINLGERLS